MIGCHVINCVTYILNTDVQKPQEYIYSSESCYFVLTFLGASVVLLDVAGTQPWHRQREQSQSFFLLLSFRQPADWKCLTAPPTCEPGQRGSVGFRFERRPLLHAAVLRAGSVPPGTGSPEQSVPARLRQLVDELFFHVLGADPRLLVPSKGTPAHLCLVKSTKIHFFEMGSLVYHTHFIKLTCLVFSKLYIEFFFKCHIFYI